MRVIISAVLILLGLFLLLNPGQTFGAGEIIALFWPIMFAIPLSILFHWMYFAMTKRKAPGLLIPGGILFTVGIVCQIGMLFDNWHYIWPGFVLAPAIGLFEFYWFGGRNKWLLIPISILTVLSAFFFIIFTISHLFNQFAGQPIIAIVFMVVGIALLFSYRKSSN